MVSWSMTMDQKPEVGLHAPGPADSLSRSSFDNVPEQQIYPRRPSMIADHTGGSDIEKGDSQSIEDGGEKLSESAQEINGVTLIQEDEIRRPGSRNSIASKRSRVSHIVSKVMSKSSKKGKTEHIDPLVLPLSDLDRGVVGWDSQDDPRMPLNFPKHRRLAMVMLLAFMTLMAPLSSSIIAPAIASYSAEFHATDDTIADMPVSIFLLGFAVGPLFLAPMSEIYGRVIVLTCSNLVFCLFMIGCALAPSLGSLIAFRFLSGIGGAACLTLGGGVIADMFPVEERGLAMSLWTIGPTVGPSLAPLIGAFIAGSIGWRWAPWIVFIPALPTTIAMAIVFPETNHRVLIQRKVKALRKSLNRPELESCYSTPEIRSMSNWAIIRRGLLRPLKMLCLSPIITVLSIYISFVYGTIYLMYNTVPTVFESVYGWSLGISGLAFLSLGFGYGIGLWLFSFISDRHVVALTARNGGVYKPEMRLPTMVWFAAITPITFFWYGWCAEKHAPWPATVVGIFPLGIGIFGIWMPAQAYIIDAYPQYAASGIAAFTVLRSVTAAFLPLAGPGMFGNLGLGWGNSVLGFICIAMIPIPVIVHRYGERIRKRFPVKL